MSIHLGVIRMSDIRELPFLTAKFKLAAAQLFNFNLSNQDENTKALIVALTAAQSDPCSENIIAARKLCSDEQLKALDHFKVQLPHDLVDMEMNTSTVLYDLFLSTQSEPPKAPFAKANHMRKLQEIAHSLNKVDVDGKPVVNVPVDVLKSAAKVMSDDSLWEIQSFTATAGDDIIPLSHIAAPLFADVVNGIIEAAEEFALEA